MTANGAVPLDCATCTSLRERVARIEAVVGNGLSEDIRTLIGEVKETREEMARFKGAVVLMQWAAGFLLACLAGVVGLLGVVL